jgi:hypothetical protein
MPLCPQITNTPITVVLNSDFTVTDVIPVLPATTTQVNVALADATAAQAAAASALAQANTAYTAAIGSLQPSANTIVNASNQITAINGNGITVYAGSSPSSGARVVLNSAGLAGFNSGGAATFSVSASTGAAVFSGDVTGSTITGGSLNIAGNAIINSSGFLTATGATITGTITATSGSFTGSIFSTNGTIGGFSIGATFLSGTGFFISSASGAGSFNALTANGNLLVNSGLVLATGASTVSAGGNTFNNVGDVNVPSGNVTLTSGRVTTNTLTVNSTTTFEGASNSFPNITTSTSAANLRWGTTTSGRIFEVVASSARFKENIVDINTVYELQANKLLNLPVRAFTYKEEYLSEGDERAEIMVPGFITEEMDEIYPIAVDYEKGAAHNWNEKFIIPGMLALIQDLYKEIKALKGE